MSNIILGKDAFVGVHNIDGIECRILIVFPDLRLYAWRLDKPGLVVFELQEKEEVDINPEEAGFHLNEEGYWIKPNEYSVVVFYDREFSQEEVDHVFEKYFPIEYQIKEKL